jgi:hypothetical protein
VIKVTQQGAPDNAFASMQAAGEFLEEIDQDFSPGHLAINHTKPAISGSCPHSFPSFLNAYLLMSVMWFMI